MSENLNFRLVFDSHQLEPSKIESSVLSFENEIKQLSGVEKVLEQRTHKDIDPLIFATLSVSLVPLAATKFFEFLNAWALRRENRLIKIKIQLGKDKVVEFEGSETMSKKEVEAWIRTIEKSLQSKK